MKSIIIILSVIVSFTHGEYSFCDSELGTTKAIVVSNCNADDDVCVLKRRTNATIEITFTPKENSDVVKAVVHGEILGEEVPFSVPNSDGCVNSGLSCPLQAGVEYVYKASLPILGIYPRVTVTVKWELVNKDKKDLACILIPAQIK